MFDHPWHHGMVYWDVLPDSGLEAQFDCPEESADKTHADLGAGVGLRVSGCGLLFGELLEALALNLRQLYDARHQGLHRWLVV